MCVPLFKADRGNFHASFDSNRNAQRTRDTPEWDVTHAWQPHGQKSREFTAPSFFIICVYNIYFHAGCWMNAIGRELKIILYQQRAIQGRDKEHLCAEKSPPKVGIVGSFTQNFYTQTFLSGPLTAFLTISTLSHCVCQHSPPNLSLKV